MTKDQEQLLTTFTQYQNNGHLILAVTLTPSLKVTEFTSRSQDYRSIWDQFLFQIDRRLSRRNGQYLRDAAYAIESDSVKVQSSSLYHFHGIVAIHKNRRNRVWMNGSLNHSFQRSLQSLKHQSPYRFCPLESSKVEIIAPTKEEALQDRPFGEEGVHAWIRYATKPYFHKAVPLSV